MVRRLSVPLPEDLFTPCPSHPVETIANLDSIPIEECGEAMVLLTEACPGVRIQSPARWARPQVASRIVQVAARLKEEGLDLVVVDAWRAPSRQLTAHYMARLMARVAHPHWPSTLVRELANKYVAAPDSLCPPPHSTGGAIDVTLRYSDGRPTRLMPAFAPVRTAHRDFTDIPEEMLSLRRTLQAAMEEAGFSNYEEEWWHWSYGDSGWALRENQCSAIYGRTFPGDCPTGQNRAE